MAESRRLKGWSQKMLASKCGLSEQAQVNFEKDRQLPGSGYLLDLVNLGIDVSYVLTGEPAVQSPDEAELLHNYRLSSASQRANILEPSSAAGQASRGSGSEMHLLWERIRAERIARGYASAESCADASKTISRKRMVALEGGSMKPLNFPEMVSLAHLGFDINFVLTGERVAPISRAEAPIATFGGDNHGNVAREQNIETMNFGVGKKR